MSRIKSRAQIECCGDCGASGKAIANKQQTYKIHVKLIYSLNASAQYKYVRVWAKLCTISLSACVCMLVFEVG